MEFATKETQSREIALILSRPTLGRLAGGLRQFVKGRLIFRIIDLSEPLPRIFQRLRESEPDGVIMEFTEDLADLALSLGKPVVFVMSEIEIDGVGSVRVNDLKVGQLAADYLSSRQLPSYGIIGRPTSTTEDQFKGFCDFFDSRKAEVEVLRFSGGHESHRERVERIEKWLANFKLPVGIYSTHDELARDLMESCERMELEVPADVAILSSNDEGYLAELVYPGISTIEVPWDKIGILCGELMESMLIEVESPEHLVVDPIGIRTRGSTDLIRVSDERVQAAVRWMHEHFREDIGIENVVTAAGINRRGLERLFRDQLKQSPKEVLTEIRLKHARELIEQTEMTITEISESCGFGNSEKLAMAFRKSYGTTPRLHRKASSTK